jgi:hypothetical protein
VSKHPRKPGHNVVPMPSKPAESRILASDFPGNAAGSGAPAAAAQQGLVATEWKMRRRFASTITVNGAPGMVKIYG